MEPIWDWVKEWFTGFDSFFEHLSKSAIAIVGWATLDGFYKLVVIVFTISQLYFLFRDKWWRERQKDK